MWISDHTCWSVKYPASPFIQQQSKCNAMLMSSNDITMATSTQLNTWDEMDVKQIWTKWKPTNLNKQEQNNINKHQMKPHGKKDQVRTKTFNTYNYNFIQLKSMNYFSECVITQPHTHPHKRNVTSTTNVLSTNNLGRASYPAFQISSPWAHSVIWEGHHTLHVQITVPPTHD